MHIGDRYRRLWQENEIVTITAIDRGAIFWVESTGLKGFSTVSFFVKAYSLIKEN